MGDNASILTVTVNEATCSTKDDVADSLMKCWTIIGLLTVSVIFIVSMQRNPIKAVKKRRGAAECKYGIVSCGFDEAGF